MTTNLLSIIFWTVTTNWTQPNIITPQKELWDNRYSSAKDSMISYSETGVISSNEVLSVIFKGKTNEVSKTEHQFKIINHKFHWEQVKQTDKREEQLLKKGQKFFEIPLNEPMIRLENSIVYDFRTQSH